MLQNYYFIFDYPAIKEIFFDSFFEIIELKFYIRINHRFLIKILIANALDNQTKTRF